MRIKKLAMTTYSTRIVKIVDAAHFLKLVSENKEAIKSSKIVYPKIGSKGLGMFRVELSVR